MKSEKSKPNPDYVNAPYVVSGWDDKRGFFTETWEPPAPVDGDYSDGKGNTIRIVNGKIVKKN